MNIIICSTLVYFSIYDQLFKSYTKPETDNTRVPNIAYVAFL